MNAKQISEYEELGITYIKALATDLQVRESKIYKEAITNNNRIL
ncbi:hypothetical protein [Cellulophaga omnivescoria]|nr:hypothetical protein [Cellulophaga omnivescoria]WBU89356.1 hypothetical protein PBN93_15975 [Cellulophaga omnivescoria]